MRELKEPNWPYIVEVLIERGYTQKAIEYETGVPQGQISKMLNKGYVNMSYKYGKAIMDLYTKTPVKK